MVGPAVESRPAAGQLRRHFGFQLFAKDGLEKPELAAPDIKPYSSGEYQKLS